MNKVRDSWAQGAQIRAQKLEDTIAADALLDEVFGPGRHAKSAQRVREMASLAPRYSCMTFGPSGEMSGVCRQYWLQLGNSQVLFLGPLAVRASHRGQGLGRAMIAWCVANSPGMSILTIGNLSFFGAWGFVRVAGVDLGVPVASNRVLGRVGKDQREFVGKISALRAATPT